jgi:hypothetical protein
MALTQINGDDLTQSLLSGGGVKAAAVIIGVGLAVLGIVVLQRFLHAAVDAS